MNMGGLAAVIMQANHHPLILVPGGPGLPHDYLETLEGAAKDDRVVVLFDPVGTGNSSGLPSGEAASDLLGTSALIAQVRKRRKNELLVDRSVASSRLWKASERS